jgi:hypothetical protein
MRYYDYFKYVDTYRHYRLVYRVYAIGDEGAKDLIATYDSEYDANKRCNQLNAAVQRMHP